MIGGTLKPVIAASILAITFASARDVVNNLAKLPGINYKFVKGRVPATPDQLTQNYQAVHAHRGSGTNSKSAVAILGAHQRQLGGVGSYENITSTTAYGTQYAIQLSLHDTPLMFILDTGSSDTWAVQEGFHCVDFTGQDVEQDSCRFGPPYPADFQYGSIPEEHLYIKYGDGETVYGEMGYSDITIGNITVEKQEVGLVNTTYWFGNNMTSGVIGLAFPTLTSAYTGNGSEHTWLQQVSYSPLFTTMVSNGLIRSYFSIAISRNSSNGMIGWGGIPPVTGLEPSTSVAMDIVITNLVDNPFATWEYSFYTIIPDGFQWGSTTDLKKFPFIIDTGTTLIYLPPPLAAAINAAFNPSAVYLWTYGAYFTSCTAQAPPFAVILDGVKFYINPVDLIYRDLVDPLTGLCMTAIASGGAGPYILGDVFLQNVLAVFDVGNAQMRFTSRQYY